MCNSAVYAMSLVRSHRGCAAARHCLDNIEFANVPQRYQAPINLDTLVSISYVDGGLDNIWP